MEFWPGVIIPRWIVTRGHNSTLNCDSGPKFHVELWPGPRFHVEICPRVMIPRWNVTQVLIPRWITTPGLNSTLNCNPESWFNFKLWPRIGITIQCRILTRVIIQREILTGVTIQCWILTRPHIFYPWNCDSRRCQFSTVWSNSTAKEGHNSTKNPLNIDPESVFNEGVKILSYTGEDGILLLRNGKFVMWNLKSSCLS